MNRSGSNNHNSAPLIVCALVVAVCVLLVSQKECAVPIRSLAVRNSRDGGGAAQDTVTAPPSSTNLLAYEQSFGYFDDITDEDWRERQRRAQTHKHYRTPKNNVAHDDTDPGRWYMLNYFPLFSCPNQQRVGGAGDGAKWVCDPLRLKKDNINIPADADSTPDKAVTLPAPAIETTKHSNTSSSNNKCLVYSVGCSGNYDFEDGLVEMLGAGTCEIHVFDLSQDYTRPDDAPTKDIHFHYWGLKSSYDKSGLSSKYTYKTLQESMQELGHVGRTIDLFKIDCEGCEWTTYKDWISDEVDVRQLMIETHRLGPGNPAALFDDIQNAGFAMYSKEPNIFPMVGGRCVEWSFVRLHRDFFRQQQEGTAPALASDEK